MSEMNPPSIEVPGPSTKREVINRIEMFDASINLGGQDIDLSAYATTGLVGVAIGPRGYGKTNAGLVVAERLSEMGWVSILIDPESELQSLYGDAVQDAEELRQVITERSRPIVVVAAADADAFLPYGRVILEVADEVRKPMLLFIDEGQLFSASKSKEGKKEASGLINEIAERGRKRALDLFITSLRFSASLHRTIFSNKNLTLVGALEDPLAWSPLAPQFRSSGLTFNDLNGLLPSEFICFSRQGVEKVRMPMSKALAKVAPASPKPKRILPTTFSQWNRAMMEVPDDRLEALTEPVISLLGSIAGLSTQQMMAGSRALADEREGRS